jgi:hypothetical protein
VSLTTIPVLTSPVFSQNPGTIAYFIYAFDFNLFVLADCMSNAGMGVDLTSGSRKEQEGLKCGLQLVLLL